MSVALACAWKPRGELQRFFDHYRFLTDQYSQVFISLPPESPPEYSNKLRKLTKVIVVQPNNWSAGRHAAVFSAVDRGNSFVHYVDFDRLLRWVETNPDEIPEVVDRIRRTDCLIIGRSEKALMTHADALQQTERIVNFVFSHFLGQPVDLGGGSRGFSKKAVDFLKKHSSPDDAIGTDASWTILLHRARFNVQTVNVDGLTWEVPDHLESLSIQNPKETPFVKIYDQDANHWKLRVQTAFEILKAGFDALDQTLDEKSV
jgi:hypothetical protein